MELSCQVTNAPGFLGPGAPHITRGKVEDLDDRLMSLLHRWVQRRERKASGKSLWPGIGYRIVRKGIAYEVVAAGFELSRCTAALDPDNVDVMGEAFFALPEWKAAIIWIWATTGATESNLREWNECKISLKLSDSKLHSILLDLQHEARKRGL